MKALITRRIVPGLFGSLAFLLAASGAWAHDPFDFSSRLTVQDADVEITVTLGLDAARQVLAAAGFSREKVAESVRPGGPHAVLDLPASVAGQLFEINSGGEKLAARSATVLSEGMEVIFTLRYPRPATGTLEARAVCYDAIKELRQGSFVASDENANQLGGALLSRASVTAQVSLPAIKTSRESPESPSSAAVGTPVPALPTEAAAAPPSASRPTFGQFFKLGVEHILTGFDHLLFLMALLIGVRKPVAMLGIVTCFTLAHSVTLALAAMNVVTISSRVVEPLIAVSIIVVCVENLWRANAAADRFWLAGGFGLIHGFGFAGALRETGLGQAGVSLAVPLASFNLGVEAGQLAVAAVFLPVLLLMRRWQGFARYGAPAISVCVILVSGYWLLERTVLFR